MSFYIQRMFVVFVGVFFMTQSMASPFPRGCEVSGFGYNNNYLILNDRNQQTLYLIQNRTDKPIELEHVEAANVFMSPKLHSKIDSHQWAAFASDTENMHFKCFNQENDATTVLNCSDVLEICQYPRVKFALSNMGTYWISTNKEQGQVIKEAAAKGIYLRW